MQPLSRIPDSGCLPEDPGSQPEAGILAWETAVPLPVHTCNMHLLSGGCNLRSLVWFDNVLMSLSCLLYTRSLIMPAVVSGSSLRPVHGTGYGIQGTSYMFCLSSRYLSSLLVTSGDHRLVCPFHIGLIGTYPLDMGHIPHPRSSSPLIFPTSPLSLRLLPPHPYRPTLFIMTNISAISPECHLN